MTGRRALVGATVLALASGLPMGVLSEFLPVYLKQTGASVEVVGAASALLAPYTFKAAWSPLVERLGHLRAQAVVMLLGIAGICALGPQLGAALIPAFFVVAVLSATQDVAIDGWVVALVPLEHQGRAAGLRVAGYRIAMALTGGGALWLSASWGWSGAWWAISALCVGVAGLVARLPRPPVAAPTSTPAYFVELGRWLRERGALAALAFALCYKLGDAAMAPMVKLFWLDAGLSVEDVGLYSVLLGSIVTGFGALAGGEVVSRIGQVRSIFLLGGLQLASNLVYGAVALAPTRLAILGAGGFESLTQGLGTAPLFAVLMRACGREQPAVRFAILTATAALGRTIAGGISGFAASEIGYSGWFFVTTIFALPALALAPLLDRGPRDLP